MSQFRSIKKVKIEDHFDKYGIKYEKDFLKIPVLILREKDQSVSIVSYSETDRMLPNSPSGHGKSLEEATLNFWLSHNIQQEYIENMAKKAYKWVPIRIVPWKQIGGQWLSIYGFRFYFRYGKGMRGGRYVPFTLFNITFSNYWKK